MGNNFVPLKRDQMKVNDVKYSPGALMLDVEGLRLSDDERQLLARSVVGGVILFSRNYTDPEQLRILVGEIRQCNPQLLLAVDQEGGRVQRFREGFVRLPPLHSLASVYAESAEEGRRLSHLYGWVMASEILYHGLDFSFAPVLDLYNPESEVIAERAFADSVTAVCDLATAYIEGMHEAGMIATGKHYPGHGTVVADSHVSLPRDERSAEEILENDFKVFANLVNLLDGVMPAHVVYPQIDAESAGFSTIWIQEKLRTQLGFEGVVFSDDLSMVAAHASGDPVQRAEKALAAGCDMVLACNDRDAALAIADYLEACQHPGNHRLANLHGTPRPGLANLYNSDSWNEALLELQVLQS